MTTMRNCASVHVLSATEIGCDYFGDDKPVTGFLIGPVNGLDSCAVSVVNVHAICDATTPLLVHTSKLFSMSENAAFLLSESGNSGIWVKTNQVCNNPCI